MKHYIVIVFALLLGLSSCKKQELPKPQDGEPIVWIEGKVNNVPFKFTAGENATYANVITHNIDSQSRQFIFKIDAPDFKKSIEISINNWQKTLGDVNSDLASTIQPGVYKFTYSNAFPFIPYRKSEVIFLYNDLAAGVKYYTIPYAQQLSGQFEIVSVKDVEHEGKTYKLAEIKFSCRVKNPYNNWWYDITEGYGFIPFGQK